MPEAATRATVDFEQLNERLIELEHRVAELEGRGVAPIARKAETPPKVDSTHAETWAGFPSPKSGGAVPVIGKAVLALAGAYLFRALAESPAMPKLPVLLVAIGYACVWMWLGLRAYGTKSFSGVTYAVTSVAILSPLLWESTVRFQYLSPAFTGAVLVAFVGMTLVRSWKERLEVLPWIAALSAIFTTLALIVFTHALLPLTLTLLAICMATEVSAWFGRPLTFRVIPALATSMSLLLMVDIMTSADGVPEGYTVVSPTTVALVSLVFLTLYGATAAVQTFGRGKQITVFEIPLAVLAFMTGCFGAVRATHGRLIPALQVMFLVMAVVCCYGASRRFALKEQPRNHIAFATWGVLLLIAGSYVFPTNVQVMLLCAAAITAFFYFERTMIITVGAASSLLLFAAVVASSLATFILDTMLRSVPAAPGFSVWLALISCVVCFAIAVRFPDEERSRRWLSLVPAGFTSFAVAALIVMMAVWLLGGRAEVTASRLSVIRTIVNCAMAMTLGLLGSRWARAELRWLTYAAVGFGTVKMLLEDLRYGNAISLVFSLLFYGTILILLPQLTNRSQAATTK